MNYLGIHFKVTPVQPGTDILIAMLGEYNFDSFVNTDNGFDAFIKEEDFSKEMIDEIPEMDFTFTYEIEKIEQKNWNAEWESNFHPVFVEDKCCIRASFHEKPSNVQLDILIDPKMSFGTGHHDTTWLMSRELFSLDLTNKSLLDMGCGTGVLAIIAKKLSASSVEGIDIDDWSIENSIENGKNNHTEGITFYKGNANSLVNKHFDIVLANINRNVLLNDMHAYYDCLPSGGLLLLSGFFESDFDELNKKATSLGFSFDKKEAKNGWCMLKYKKN